jgi:Nucleotidyltransferase domain
MDEVGSDTKLREIASRFSELEHVEAVALAGSAAAGTSDSQSDYDFYVYSHQPVHVAFRDDLLRPRAQRLELHRTFWEDKDAWIEPDGTEFQIMYRTCAWTEGELTARLDRCEASLGYTIAICYSMERFAGTLRPFWLVCVHAEAFVRGLPQGTGSGHRAEEPPGSGCNHLLLRAANPGGVPTTRRSEGASYRRERHSCDG